MTGHRPFKEVTANFSREQRTRVVARVEELRRPITARQGKRLTRKSKTKSDSPARDRAG